jgi:hypothetical protein
MVSGDKKAIAGVIIGLAAGGVYMTGPLAFPGVPIAVWQGFFWLSIVMLAISVSYFVLVHTIRATPRSCLHCSFAKEIPGCVQRDAKAFFRRAPHNDPTIPPLVTVSTSQGSSFVSTSINITHYRIKVEVIGERQIKNCSGRLRSISRGDRVWGNLNIPLTFEPAENREEAIAKTIHPGIEQFLDVFYITDDSRITIHSYRNLPGNINIEEIFSEPREYILEIVFTANDCGTETVNLLLNWTGDMKTASVSRMMVSS